MVQDVRLEPLRLVVILLASTPHLENHVRGQTHEDGRTEHTKDEHEDCEGTLAGVASVHIHATVELCDGPMLTPSSS